jgi:hypothetical protein
VAPDGHAVSVHAQVGYGHIVVHLSIVTVVDAAWRRHKPIFPSSRKYVVFVNSDNVPGIAPVSLLSYSHLLSQNGEHLLYERQRAKKVCAARFKLLTQGNIARENTSSRPWHLTKWHKERSMMKHIITLVKRARIK